MRRSRRMPYDITTLPFPFGIKDAPMTTGTPTPVILTAPENLVTWSRQAYKQRALDALAAGAKALVLDLSATGYIDSTGLGVLVSIKHACHRNGVSLVLAGLNEDLRSLLEITKIGDLFVLADTVGGALQHLGKSAA